MRVAFKTLIVLKATLALNTDKHTYKNIYTCGAGTHIHIHMRSWNTYKYRYSCGAETHIQTHRPTHAELEHTCANTHTNSYKC